MFEDGALGGWNWSEEGKRESRAGHGVHGPFRVCVCVGGNTQLRSSEHAKENILKSLHPSPVFQVAVLPGGK